MQQLISSDQRFRSLFRPNGLIRLLRIERSILECKSDRRRIDSKVFDVALA